MLLYFIGLAFFPLCLIASGIADGEVKNTLASTSTDLTLPTLSNRPSNVGRRRSRMPWTAAQRELFDQTIATRTVTEEMKNNWREGRRKSTEGRQRAVALGLAPKLKWSQERREKFAKTIATREKTEEMRANWSRVRRGRMHTDETKFFMGMRKLGVGKLPDGETKRPARQGMRARCSMQIGTPCSDAKKEAISISQKARWAKVRALEQQDSAGEVSTSEQM